MRYSGTRRSLTAAIRFARLALQEPMGNLDLKLCVTAEVGLIPRDVCARPNSFELRTVRRQMRGETDTLVSKCYNTMTTTK